MYFQFPHPLTPLSHLIVLNLISLIMSGAKYKKWKTLPCTCKVTPFSTMERPQHFAPIIFNVWYPFNRTRQISNWLEQNNFSTLKKGRAMAQVVSRRIITKKGMDSIPGQCMWSFRRREWLCDRLSSDNLHFPLSVIIPPILNSQFRVSKSLHYHTFEWINQTCSNFSSLLHVV